MSGAIRVRGRLGDSRIEFGSLGGLGGRVDPGRSVIVTDAQVRGLHGHSFPPCPVIEVPRGEAAKSLAALEGLYGGLLDAGVGRDWSVVAIGGGSVSDLAGFAAATWLRGLDFVFAPTTLLAMVDASVGGKNGLDFRGYKNLIGSFRQPRSVLMDVGLLATLDVTQFASGAAEAIKHAVISGGRYFRLLEAGAGATPRDRIGLERLVRPSVALKAAIVSSDEREEGRRRVLNLGHSVGHAVERVLGLPHGHCVAVGLACACRLSLLLGRMEAADLDRILALLGAWDLPASIGAAEALALRGGPQDFARPRLRDEVAAAIGMDKKRTGSEIQFVLPEAIGSVKVRAIGIEELRAFVREAP